MGDVYISDGSGRYFSLSIDNVLKGSEYVDFEKVNSLDGVFIANKYDVSRGKKTTTNSKGKKE